MHVSRDGYLGLLPGDVHKLLTDLLYNQSDGFTFTFVPTHFGAQIAMRCGNVSLVLELHDGVATTQRVAEFIQNVSKGKNDTLPTSHGMGITHHASFPFRLSIVNYKRHPGYIDSLPLCKGLIDVLCEASLYADAQ